MTKAKTKRVKVNLTKGKTPLPAEKDLLADYKTSPEDIKAKIDTELPVPNDIELPTPDDATEPTKDEVKAMTEEAPKDVEVKPSSPSTKVIFNTGFGDYKIGEQIEIDDEVLRDIPNIYYVLVNNNNER